MAVTDEAIFKIKGMIVSGEIRPGERLPPEKELSELLGLSRNSLREAVKALEVIGVLNLRRGDGTYVTYLEPRLLLEALTFVVELRGDSSVLEILAVRRILESAAVEIATPLLDGQAVANLRAQIESVGESTSVEGLVSHDLQFHSAIVAGAANPYLSNLIDSLSSDTVRARIWRGLTQANSVSRTLAEHHAIVDAIELGDSGLARALMIMHISGVERWLRDAIDHS